MYIYIYYICSYSVPLRKINNKSLSLKLRYHYLFVPNQFKTEWFKCRFINSIDSFTGQSVPAPITWFPPIPWQGYIMRGFPPSLLSPASKHASFPSFFIWRETGGNGTDCGFVKLFKQKGFLRDPMHSGKPQRPDKPRRNTGTSQPLCTHSPRQTAAGWDRAWRPPDRRSSNTRKSSYMEFVPEIYTLGDVSKRALWRETVASL